MLRHSRAICWRACACTRCTRTARPAHSSTSPSPCQILMHLEEPCALLDPERPVTYTPDIKRGVQCGQMRTPCIWHATRHFPSSHRSSHAAAAEQGAHRQRNGRRHRRQAGQVGHRELLAGVADKRVHARGLHRAHHLARQHAARSLGLRIDPRWAQARGCCCEAPRVALWSRSGHGLGLLSASLRTNTYAQAQSYSGHCAPDRPLETRRQGLQHHGHHRECRARTAALHMHGMHCHSTKTHIVHEEQRGRPRAARACTYSTLGMRRARRSSGGQKSCRRLVSAAPLRCQKSKLAAASVSISVVMMSCARRHVQPRAPLCAAARMRSSHLPCQGD